ncbi:MAG: hypothetical protein AAFR28_14200 [Pseudomonadota bacterium]
MSENDSDSDSGAPTTEPTKPATLSAALAGDDAPPAAPEAQGDKADAGAKEPAAGADPASWDLGDLPEGLTISDGQRERVNTLASELGLSRDQLVGALPFYVEMMNENLMAHHAAQTEAWEAEGKADKEIGGARYAETLGQAEAFVERYGSKELVQTMQETGMLRHPGILRMLKKADDVTRDDRGVSGGGPPNKPKTALELMYNS